MVCVSEQVERIDEFIKTRWLHLDLTPHKEEVSGCMSGVSCSMTCGKQMANGEEKLDDKFSIPSL